MKNYFKLFLIISIFTLHLQMDAQVKFGLKGGIGLSNIDFRISGEDKDLIDDDDLKTKNITAFHLGGVVEFPLSENLNLQSGLLFSRKGFAVDEADLESDKYFFTYLQVPFHLIYHNSNFQAFVGPYFSHGLAGLNRWKYDGDTELEDLEPTTKTVSFDDDQSYFNAFDYGIDLGVGYQVGPILINAGYSFGLGNIQPKYEDIDIGIDITMSYRTISLSGTYFFGDAK